MIASNDPDVPLFLFPIEDVSDQEVKVLDSAEKFENGAGSRLTEKSTLGELKALEAETHARELVTNLISFRSSMSRLGCVFGDYATRPNFWFAAMCFGNWLALNSCILRGSWACPSETRDGLRDFLTQKGLNYRTLYMLAQNHNSHVRVGESVYQIFQRAEVERQRFETAYNALHKLDGSKIIETPGFRSFCQGAHHLLHPNSLDDHPCSEHGSCSEPVHLLGSLDRIATLLDHVVEAGKNEPEMMSNLKEQFDNSSSRSCRLDRDLAQLETIRHTINIQRLSDNSQDSLISIKIDDLERSRRYEKCLRQGMMSCLLGVPETSFEEFGDIFEVNESNRRRNLISRDLRMFRKWTSVTQVWA